MTSELFVRLITTLGVLIVTIISAYVLPYIKTRVTAEQIAQLTWYIKFAVRCAEQIYTPEEWKNKKAYVMEKATSFINNFLHINITNDDLDTIVEGIVNEIKKG